MEYDEKLSYSDLDIIDLFVNEQPISISMPCSPSNKSMRSMNNGTDEDDEDECGKCGKCAPCPYVDAAGHECGNTTTHGFKYCLEHRQKKCYCGVQATHACGDRVTCEHPLCDNYYCEGMHNRKKHLKINLSDGRYTFR